MRAVTAAAAALGLAGCLMTKQEGTELRSASDALDKRLTQVEGELQAKYLALEAKLAEMQQTLESARSLLTRDSADVGAQVQAQAQALAALEGKLDELSHGLQQWVQQSAKRGAEVDEKLGKLAAVKPATGEVSLDPALVPEDKTAHFAAAYEAYKGGEHEKARGLFKEYLSRYPQDDKAGDAQYWIGASFLVQNKPATALGEYRKVISGFPKSAAVDTALYGMADAFFRLHACTDAKGALDALRKRKPSKALADRANDLGKAIAGATAGYCTS